MFCGAEEVDSDAKSNKNEFGWWMNETETVISSPFRKNSEISNSISFSNSRDLDDFNLTEDSIFSSKTHGNGAMENKNKGKIEEMELTVNVDFDKTQDGEENFIENGFRKSLGFSYTPERLVKSKEYKILSPPFQSACIHSSKFRQRKLNELIDPNKIGGTNLQKLLCPNIMAIKDPDYFGLKGHFDLHVIKNQIKQGSFSSLITNFKELKTLSEEKGNRKFSSAEEENTSEIQSLGSSLDTASSPTKALPRVENLKRSCHKEDESTFEDIKVESEISTVLLDDSENFTEIQSKVKRLRDVNEDMQKDIGTLKDDFQNDEWKVNILLEEAINFRREIQELQYLDNLVNLLRGEFERISPKTWPFIRNHTDPYSEEINLII